MPQFDTFIFSSSLFYFIISFFVLLYCNFTQFLPRLGSILKLRHKITKKSVTANDLLLPYQDQLTIFSRNITISDKN